MSYSELRIAQFLIEEFMKKIRIEKIKEMIEAKIPFSIDALGKKEVSSVIRKIAIECGLYWGIGDFDGGAINFNGHYIFTTYTATLFELIDIDFSVDPKKLTADQHAVGEWVLAAFRQSEQATADVKKYGDDAYLCWNRYIQKISPPHHFMKLDVAPWFFVEHLLNGAASHDFARKSQAEIDDIFRKKEFYKTLSEDERDHKDDYYRFYETYEKNDWVGCTSFFYNVTPVTHRRKTEAQITDILDPHKAVKAQYAELEKIYKEPWRLIEVANEGEWYDSLNDVPLWLKAHEYRVKPQKFIQINGLDVPEPVRYELVDGMSFFVPSIDTIALYCSDWSGNRYARAALRKGIAHLSKENAIAHAEALLALTAVS